jgi:hypothetical protein
MIKYVQYILLLKICYQRILNVLRNLYRGADKSLAQPGRKQATATDFEFHISYL